MRSGNDPVVRPLLLVAVLASTWLVTGCHNQKSDAGDGKDDAEEAAPDAGPRKKTSAESVRESPTGHARPDRKFSVPFAWEASQADALARTRGFLGNMTADNRGYTRTHGEAFFAAFADVEKPRATIVACGDSRVHTTAFAAVPENDAFMVRNIGNQVKNSEGSVEYGIHQLHTPLLLIMGHTGCSAVKAAMGDISQLSEPIRRELANLEVAKAPGDHAARATEPHEPKPLQKAKHDAGVSEDARAAWADAVIVNVNNQVKASIAQFGTEIEEGHLTVVGAVFDFRNDLKRGFGAVVLVNVNGQTDGDTVAAFERAVTGAAATGPATAAATAPADDSRPQVTVASKETSHSALQQLLQNAPLKASVKPPAEPTKAPAKTAHAPEKTSAHP